MNIEEPMDVVALIKLCNTFSRAISDATVLQNEYKLLLLSSVEADTLYESLEYVHRQMDKLDYEIFVRPGITRRPARGQKLR